LLENNVCFDKFQNFLQALQGEIAQHQRDLDLLSDSAQDLMQVSADSRVVSQASQLATRYQTATINSKVNIRYFRK
jgi:hypothetical protein